MFLLNRYTLGAGALFAIWQNLPTISYYGGKTLGSAALEAAKGFTQDLPSTTSLGERAGQDLNGNINKFFDNLQLSEITNRIGNEINSAFESALKGLNVAKVLEDIAKEIGEGLRVIRENGVNEIDLFRGDIQSIFANMARDTTLKMIPWVALGSAFLVGTPLLTMYAYKKAVHNIGKPKLAQDSRKVGLWDRTTDHVYHSVSCVWDAAKVGIKWSALAGACGLTLATVEAAASQIADRDSYGANILDGLSCAMGLNSYHCNPKGANIFLSSIINLGSLRAGAHLTGSFYGYVKNSTKSDVQPIFDGELQKRIDQLTHATYNINRNGGYMQNLLLYGPGGTGKTMVAKYIAKNSQMNYVMMSGGDLAQYIKRGEHVTELTKFFEAAKNSHTPSILFIDECESLCGDRGKMDRSELIELVNSFLNQTGEPSKKIMIILTTNRKDDLDPAVLSRMDHILYIGPPKLEQRKKIIELYLPTFMTKLERKELFTEETVSKIAQDTKGFTGRTLFKMLNTISSIRATTSDNRLNEQIVTDTVKAFVKQNKDIQQGSPLVEEENF